MTDPFIQSLNYLQSRSELNLTDLIDWCSIPSISSIATHQPDIQKAAEWAAQRLSQAGMQNVEILPTQGHPCVYGDWLKADRDFPTILFYGHYDVQPALDLDAWVSPPFEPQLRDGRLYARGASDMKGQALAEIVAIEAVLKITGKLPLNVKFLLEGEEEIGSRHLRGFIKENQYKLTCDYAIIIDAGMLNPDLPAITYGLRGGMRIFLEVYGPCTDLHSGVFGGTIHNPAQALIELIAGMHDEDGRVTLPGFYDGVRPITESERLDSARLPIDETYLLEMAGVAELWGDPDYSPYERTTSRPTLEVLAIQAGLPGEGVLNIIPAKASAALSMRLVPDQDPKAAYQSLIDYLQENAPPTIRWETRFTGGGRGVLVDRNTPYVKAMHRALQETWGTAPVYLRMGGGIPVVGMFQQELGIESVMTGFGLMDDNVHGPNEHLHLQTWQRGMQALVRFLFEAAM